MKKNELEIKIKDFSNYLMEIGLLNISCYNDFSKIFMKISENEFISSGNEETDKNIELIYFKENACKAILNFFNTISEERKKILSLNIFTKYNLKKKEKNNNQIKNINLIESKYEYKIEKLPSINILSKNNENKKEIINDSSNIEIKISKRNEIIKNFKSNSIITEKMGESFLEKKIKSKIKGRNNNFLLNHNCTFQPNIYIISDSQIINKKRKMKKDKILNKNNESVFERLNKISEAKEEEIENLKRELNKENIFQPNMNKNKGNSITLKRENFDKRLKNYEEEKKYKELKRREEEQKEFQKKFPFNPKPYNAFKVNNIKNSRIAINIHQKLYEDNLTKKQKYEDRIKKVMNEIKERTNHPIQIHNDIKYLYTSNYNINNENKNFKRNYSNYKKRKEYQLEYYKFKSEENNKSNRENEMQKIEKLYNKYKKLKD